MSGDVTFDGGASGLPSRGMTVRVLLYPGEDGYLVAECPELRGCASQGETRDEALANIREAIDGWLEVEAAADSTRRPVEIVELAV
jgi:predicted RNase H-like HicB family nuclease